MVEVPSAGSDLNAQTKQISLVEAVGRDTALHKEVGHTLIYGLKPKGFSGIRISFGKQPNVNGRG